MFKCTLRTRIGSKPNNTMKPWHKEVELFIPPVIGQYICVSEMSWTVKDIYQDIDHRYVQVNVEDMCDSENVKFIEDCKNNLREAGWKEFKYGG